MKEFLDMGGYAAFVWPAYGVALTVLALMVVEAVLRLKRRQAELARLEGTEE